MNTVIVDDNDLARIQLRIMLKEFKCVTVLAEANDGQSGIQAIKKHNPDLVFLDIEMPDINGFEVLKELSDIPSIIFVSAHSDYAIKAFDVHAVDYLVKPFRADRLGEALDRVLDRSKIDTAGSMMVDHVFIKDGNECWFVPKKSLRLIESHDNYVQLYFDDKSPMVYRSLAQIESILPGNQFFKANRRQIINLTWIESIKPWYTGGLKVVLKTGETVQMSRRAARVFKTMTGV